MHFAAFLPLFHSPLEQDISLGLLWVGPFSFQGPKDFFLMGVKLAETKWIISISQQQETLFNSFKLG